MLMWRLDAPIPNKSFPSFYHVRFWTVAFIVISNAEMARRGVRGGARTSSTACRNTPARLALAQAKNDLLRQRVLDLETALDRRERAAKFAQTKAITEIARFKGEEQELQLKLRQMWTGTTTRSPRRVPDLRQAA